MAMLSFEKKVSRPRWHADRRRSVRFLVRSVLRGLLRRHDDLLRRHSARCCACGARRWDRRGTCGRSSLRHPISSYGLVLAPLREGRAVADHHAVCHRRLRQLGAPPGGDQSQARHGDAHPLGVRRRGAGLRHAGRDPAAAARRVGTWLPVRHLLAPRLGVERGVPVPPLPLQSRAHDRGDVLLHQLPGARDARIADPLGDEPEEGCSRSARAKPRTSSSAICSATRSARSASIGSASSSPWAPPSGARSAS